MLSLDDFASLANTQNVMSSYQMKKLAMCMPSRDH